MTDEFAGFQTAPEADEFAGFQAAPEEKPTTVATHNPTSGYKNTLNFAGLDTHIPISDNVQNYLAGAGKAFSDTGAGIHQIALHIGNHLGLIPDSDVEKNQQNIDNAKERDAPLMDTKTGLAGNITGQVAPMLLAPGAGVAGSAMEGALAGAVQPVATGDSRLHNAVLGGAGGAAGAAAGKVAGALGGYGVPLERKAAVDILTAEGIPTSIAQKTAAKSAQTIERASSMISDAHSEFMAHQTPAFNRAVLRRIGVTDGSTAATPDVMSSAKDAITGVMNDVAKRTKVDVDDELLNGLGTVEQDAARRLPESDIGPIKAHINDILANASNNGGHLDGTFYQKLNSSLSDLSRDARYAPIAHDMLDVVNDAVSRSANPADVAALAKARQQYRALKQIEPAIDTSTGNISPLALMRSMSNKSNRNQAIYGKGDQSLMNLAKAGKQILPDTLGNSGTAERALPALTALEVARSGEPWKAGLKAGAAIYGGGLAGRAMRNQGIIGKTLTNGVPGLRTVAPIVKDVAPGVGYGMAENKERDPPDFGTVEDTSIARASGGRVSHDELVERLIKRWRQAKRETDRATKSLLQVPDAAITKALDIAQRSI